HEIFLHFAVAEGSWNLDGTDGDYMNKVYLAVQSRRHYVVIQDNVYAMGFGRGAVIAQQAVMKMSSEWSGLATFGDLGKEAMINADATIGAQNTGKTELTVSTAKLPVPVWMGWSKTNADEENVKAYWLKQNDSSDESFANMWATEIHFPSTVNRKGSINEEKTAQVRISEGYTMSEELLEAVWTFLAANCRHRGFGAKHLRSRISPEDYGMVCRTLEHQGFTRLWYEYVPASAKNSDEPVPLVVNMHGRGGSAETFVDLSGMSRTAEERNFIVIFPEAGVYKQRPDGLANILLWNGFYKDMEFDDAGFILKAIEDVKKRYHIDTTRIYACGQSSGGMMTSSLALKAPEVFAAVSPWSAIVDPEHELVLPERIEPKVPYLFLFGENDWLCVNRKEGKLEYHVDKDIAAFLENLMDLYGLDHTPCTYTCGEVSYYVYFDRDHVPMLTVGTVKEMSHANYPRESWIAYDEFMCRFSKTADGSLLYMGRKVR
ncbi:MAG: prolyl oligopeptidase family serine peptidase, partial [Solobacterium sp.]|nr:prolyl oligopeptidase family serine peptidase [Solobacterium sp.]